MKWEEKMEMVELLNNGSWEAAFNTFMSKSPDWQARDMFITGLDLSSKDVNALFMAHEDFFTKSFIEESIQHVCWDSSIRWACVYNFLGYDDK